MRRYPRRPGTPVLRRAAPTPSRSVRHQHASSGTRPRHARGASRPPSGGWFDRSRITPNAVTIIGFLGICAAAVLALERYWVIARWCSSPRAWSTPSTAWSRATRAASPTFGAFLDSTLDRLAEGVILGRDRHHLRAGRPRLGPRGRFIALTASFLVSYARARAEGLGIPGSSGGLMGRPERLVIVGAGLFLGGRRRRPAGADVRPGRPQPDDRGPPRRPRVQRVGRPRCVERRA